LDNEIKIQQLVRLLDLVFDRCEKTLDSTPHSLLCWLKSYNQHRFYPKPFRLLQKTASKRRYRTYWKRFIYFLFRSWLIEPDLREEVYRVQYTELQLQLLHRKLTAPLPPTHAGMLVLPTWNKEGQWSLEYKCLVGDEEKGAAQSRLCHCVTSEQTVQRRRVDIQEKY
jgi:hypothetical protein